MPAGHWFRNATSQVACSVAAVLHQGALGELRAAALEVFRACLNVDISCKPVLPTLYIESNHIESFVNLPTKAQNVQGGGLFGSSAPAVKEAVLKATKYWLN